VRRASTLHIQKNDLAVVAAYELIQQQACNELKARDVAATFPCGNLGASPANAQDKKFPPQKVFFDGL